MSIEIITIGKRHVTRIACPSMSTIGIDRNVAQHQAVLDSKSCIKPTYKASATVGLLTGDGTSKHTVCDIQSHIGITNHTSMRTITIHSAHDIHLTYDVLNIDT